MRNTCFYYFNTPLQPFTWFGGIGVPGWSKLAIFWEVWGPLGSIRETSRDIWETFRRIEEVFGGIWEAWELSRWIPDPAPRPGVGKIPIPGWLQQPTRLMQYCKTTRFSRATRLQDYIIYKAAGLQVASCRSASSMVQSYASQPSDP